MAIRHSGFGRGTIWMISFGDLLTLLTCLIVGGVSAGHRSAPANRSQYTEITRSIIVEPEQADAGISLAASLAESYRRRLVVELPLFESHIASRFGEPNAVGFSLLRQMEIPEGDYEIEIEACATSHDGWHDSQRTARAIERVLVDRQIEAPRSVRSVGGRCEQLTSFTPGTEPVLAVMRMLRPLEASNG
jgi:hypothetical protein